MFAFKTADKVNDKNLSNHHSKNSSYIPTANKPTAALIVPKL
jgi:hypothetical protein